jgi:hypothetical protein
LFQYRHILPVIMGSAIRGHEVLPVLPSSPGSPSPVKSVDRDFDILFTAETHNFPCAVSASLSIFKMLLWLFFRDFTCFLCLLGPLTFWLFDDDKVRLLH